MMNKNFFLNGAVIIAFTLFVTACGNNSKTNKLNNPPDSIKTINDSLTGTLKISGSYSLYPLMLKWKEEFIKTNPNIKIDISSGGSGKGINDVMTTQVDIGMVSFEISAEEQSKGVWFVPVATDAVVAVISDNNPELETLINYGIKKETLEGIFVTGKIKSWGQAANNKYDKNNINVYYRSDSSGSTKCWYSYLGKNNGKYMGKGISGASPMIQAVLSDNFSIGYSSICYAYNGKTKLETKGIRVLPIDINGNNVIDDGEFFYHHLDSMINAISTGRYPAPPARDLYLVTNGKPNNPVLIAFIKWILTDGQKLLKENGYIKLSAKKLNAATDKLLKN
jgi:phosphate transport system substrate-binding protein